MRLIRKPDELLALTNLIAEMSARQITTMMVAMHKLAISSKAIAERDAIQNGFIWDNTKGVSLEITSTVAR